MADVESTRVKLEPGAEDQVNNNNVDDGDVEEENDCDSKYGNSSAKNANSLSNDSDDSEKTNLIVNYLPQQMADADFENLFKKFGNMKSCKIVRNRVSGYSYGFGFVDFENHEQALKAIEELNGHELDNKKIKVAFARPAGQDIKQANLYIKNVPNQWTQDDVKKIFQPYGNIIQVRVLGNNRGVAFVLFDLRKQAEEALEALNGKTVEGCETPLEIKFAADKKVEKKGNKNSSNNNGTNNNNDGTNNNNNNNNNSTNLPRKRERGHRGGRSHNKNRDQRFGRQPGQRSFFDRKNNHDDRRSGQYNSSYGGAGGGGGGQYGGNYNTMNGVGPIRQSPNNRMNRYAPFIPVPAPMTTTPTANPMAPQLTPNPAYGYNTQQPMIPFAMMPTQQMATMQPVNQPGQLAPNTMTMFGTPQMPIGYAPVAQHTMNNMYSVASNNLTNAANMHPQIGQPMTMRDNSSSTSNSNFNDDGATLFVYNIGPNADESELRSMFAPYGQVVKCNVVRKTPGGETKGFGFVTLKDRDQANSAIAGLNGSMRNGRALQVSLKK